MNTKQKAVNVLAVLRWASVSADSARDSREADEARAAVADLIDDVEPILRSLRERITQDNAMEPQAVMVRRAWDSLMRCKGE